MKKQRAVVVLQNGTVVVADGTGGATKVDLDNLFQSGWTLQRPPIPIGTGPALLLLLAEPGSAPSS